MFNQRTNPLFQKARELVQNGWLGEPKRFVWIITNWYRLQAYYNSGGWRATWDGEGGGVLLNQARTTWICGNDLWRAAAHSGILQNFTNAILYGEELLAPGFDGIRSLNISNAAYLSDWTGEPVSLPVDGDRFEELLGERVLASQKPEKGETDHFTPGAYSPRWQVRW
jgi:predicted dehydrogenase